MAEDEFVLLLGKAFLHELHHGSKESAIAFGRALLVLMERNGQLDNSQEFGTEKANSIA